MARSVTASVSLTISINDTGGTGTLSSSGIVDAPNLSRTIGYNGSGTNTSLAQQWSDLINLVISTTQTFNLLSLAAALGGTKAFASVCGIHLDNVGGFPVQIGNAASNIWTPGWSATTHVETLQPNSRYLKETNGTPWTVDSTHCNLMIDPGANPGSLKIMLWGN